MASFLVTGDPSTISLELTAVLDRLVGDEERSMLVEEFDCAESEFSPGAIVDALTTLPLFSSRRIVVARNAHELVAAQIDAVVAGLESKIPEVDVVLTVVGRPAKALTDACKKIGAETVGAVAVSRTKDRIDLVESRLVEAGFTYSTDAARLVASWFGGDTTRIAGLISTLRSAYGEGAKLSRADVEAFLGEAGSVAPWDLTDAIDRGDVDGSLKMLHRLMGAGGSHPLQILALLSNRYAQMMKLDGRSVRSAADAVEVLGGKEFTAKKVLEQYQRLGSGGVARAVSLIAGADIDLRGAKDWDNETVVEVLVARLAALGGGAARTTSRR